ncbi:MAG: brain acid soluble protein 1, partial [Bacteroidetes bacterium]|nr:brain acid soluble protein 1 [Bacteroidota bacterium]
MTKKLLTLAFIFALVQQLSAQTLTTFPTDRDKYIKAVEQMMTGSKADNLMQADEDFNKNIKTGAISDAQLQQIIAATNVLAPRNLAPFPYYYNFFTTINAFAKNKISADRFNNWLDILGQVTKGQKKGDNHDLGKFLEFSVAFFDKGALYSSMSKTWRTDAKSYTLGYESWKPVVSIPLGKLTGTTSNDTIYINSTSGKYFPTENKWYGKGGHVDWERNKLSASNVYANFRSEYVINFDNTIYSVDSVEFYYKDFFATPLYGRFTDKFVGGNDSASSYPRFDSWSKNVTLKEIVPNAIYSGGFGLWGPKVMGYGVPDTPATVTFYKRDKTKAVTAYSQSFTIKKGVEVGSPKAEVIIFNGNDTIYHPQLILTYKAKNNELRLLRGESGISKSKFFDSYHNHEFEVDAIFWNLDSSRMQLKTLNGIGQVGSVFESNNFFNKERIRQIQGGAPYEPLSIIKRMYEKTGNRELNAADLAKAIDPHLTEEQAKALYYSLVEGGFIRYDENTGTVTMRDKVINYVMSNSKKLDYDIIRLKSVPKTGTDYIDLKSNTVELKGVDAVPISDTAKVVIFPYNRSINIQKNRDMTFDGLVYGGRLDFFGRNYKFDYQPFTFDLNGLDSMRINIPDSLGRLDANGEPMLRTLLTDIVGVKGLLEVDAPINKSGRTRLSQFPKLTSKDKSYAYYDDIAGGAYKRKDFYFELQPFRLDSLNTFTPSVINWDGRLVSGGIFPDIKNKLHIMPDLSLGFDIISPDGGYALYKDGGKYEGDLTLNHSGLSGKGKIEHLTATFTSHNIMFYPDSLHATSDSFHIKKVFDGVKTPEVASTGNDIFWKTKADSMIIHSVKEKAFAMYENQTSFNGALLLTTKGLRGNGFLDWAEANLTSKDFHFQTENLSADTASMNIKSISGDKVTFKTPNVNAKIDFKNRIGDFKSNIPDNPTEFAYNQFKTKIAEFKWYIDQKILDFRVPPGSQGEYFTSTRESQMGLQFLAKRATYNLETSILRAEQVPYILIADAKVIPDSGIVVVQGEAKIDQLHKATIIADTLTAKHKIENCTVDIISKAELRGTGDYKFSTRDHKDEKITFNNIFCSKESLGDSKYKFDAYSLVAKGQVLDTTDGFFIYPKVTFNGDVSLFGHNPYLFFKGYAKINFRDPAITTSDFKIVDDVNPDKLYLHYDSTTKSSDGTPVVTGIYFNKSSETPVMYHALFTPVMAHSDPALFKAPGVVTYHEKSGEYVMGDPGRVDSGTLVGNIMRYNEAKGIIRGEGKMSFGTDFGVIKYAIVGTNEVDLAKKQYLFNMTFGIDMNLNNKNLDEKFQQIMTIDNADGPDASYEGDKFKMVYSNLADPKDDAKLISNLSVAQTFVRPKDFKYYLVFDDVRFIYDPDDLTLRSYGRFNLSFIGEKPIHKRIEGFIEVGLKANTFNIYLKTGSNEWFFFEYRPGSLGLISSYDDYNRIVATMTAAPPDKRKITGEKGQFYTYNIGSTINKSAFLDAMKDKSNPNLPAEKIIVKPKINRDSLAKAQMKTETPDTSKKAAPAAAPKSEPATTDSVGGEAPKEKEKPKSAAQRRAEKLRQKAGEDPNAVPAAPVSAPPTQPDTAGQNAPPAPAPDKKEAPAAPPTETPKSEAPAATPANTTPPPATEKPAETPAATPPAETPKSEAPASTPANTTTPPPAAEKPAETPTSTPPTETPKSEAPATTPVNNTPPPATEKPVETPAATPPAEAPKSEAPATTPVNSTPPATEKPAETPAATPPAE